MNASDSSPLPNQEFVYNKELRWLHKRSSLRIRHLATINLVWLVHCAMTSLSAFHYSVVNFISSVLLLLVLSVCLECLHQSLFDTVNRAVITTKAKHIRYRLMPFSGRLGKLMWLSLIEDDSEGDSKQMKDIKKLRYFLIIYADQCPFRIWRSWSYRLNRYRR